MWEFENRNSSSDSLWILLIIDSKHPISNVTPGMRWFRYAATGVAYYCRHLAVAVIPPRTSIVYNTAAISAFLDAADAALLLTPSLPGSIRKKTPLGVNMEFHADAASCAVYDTRYHFVRRSKDSLGITYHKIYAKNRPSPFQTERDRLASIYEIWKKTQLWNRRFRRNSSLQAVRGTWIARATGFIWPHAGNTVRAIIRPVVSIYLVSYYYTYRIDKLYLVRV